jgi:hypothetical protein
LFSAVIFVSNRIQAADPRCMPVTPALEPI